MLKFNNQLRKLIKEQFGPFAYPLDGRGFAPFEVRRHYRDSKGRQHPEILGSGKTWEEAISRAREKLEIR